MWNRVKYIALKEFRHILRDPRSLTVAILMPFVMTLLYGYAINLDVKNIRLGVIDMDKTQDSRDLVSRFFNSGYFKPPSRMVDAFDPERTLRKGDADAVLTIRPGFSAALAGGLAGGAPGTPSGAASGVPAGAAAGEAGEAGYKLGLLVDGSDANLAAATSSYSSIVVSLFASERLPEGLEYPHVTLSASVLYNPDLKSSHFFVPGLIAVILMMISALLTSITIAREKETGTMEQLLVSPVTPGELILGKVLPYLGIAFLDAFVVIAWAVFHFGVPFAGSVALLVLFTLIYIVAALSAGILISTLVRTQQVAMMVAQLITVLPSVMLSGFIFDLRNMPLPLQYISYIIPARYFQLIIRGIMLKGAGITVLWVQGACLVGLTMILLGIATRRFQLKVG